MDILPLGYLDGFKRYWRRRRYQRLDTAIKMKKKLKVARLRKRYTSNQHELKIMKIHNLGFKFLSPLKLVAKCHEAYIDAVIRLAGSKRIDHVKNEGKRAAKCQPIPILSAPTNEMVDSRLVVEIYKRVTSTRDQQSTLVPEVH